jgi:hypothetical protein
VEPGGARWEEKNKKKEGNVIEKFSQPEVKNNRIIIFHLKLLINRPCQEGLSCSPLASSSRLPRKKEITKRGDVDGVWSLKKKKDDDKERGNDETKWRNKIVIT